MSQLYDNSQLKEIIEKEFLVADLQTLLRELGISETGRKNLIQKALQLIDVDHSDVDTIEITKQKIIEVYNRRKNVEVVTNTPRNSDEEESGESNSDTNTTTTVRTEVVLSDYYKRAAIHTSLGIIVLGCVAYALINEKIDFGHYQKTNAQNLTEVGPRMQYVWQHSTPGLVWILFSIIYVMSKRINTSATVPASGNEHLVETAKNILTNSLEQFVLSVSSQMILISYLTSKQVLNIIPVLNILFLIGRISFFLGYPMSRSFGMTMNFVPIFATILFINYQYFRLFFVN